MSSTGNTHDQLKKVFNAFYEYPKTMKEVNTETNIMRENICRYVSTLRNVNQISLVGYRKC
jgi:DNA-binding transcriptional regulator LsrR (DeoR family)